VVENREQSQEQEQQDGKLREISEKDALQSFRLRSPDTGDVLLESRMCVKLIKCEIGICKCKCSRHSKGWRTAGAWLLTGRC